MTSVTLPLTPVRRKRTDIDASIPETDGITTSLTQPWLRPRPPSSRTAANTSYARGNVTTHEVYAQSDDCYRTSLRSPSTILRPATSRNISIDDFRYLKDCGTGTFGEVGLYEYLEEGSEAPRRVAIKKVLQNPSYKNREFAIQIRLNHRNIVKILVPQGIYTPSRMQGCHYLHIVMESFDKSLFHSIQRSRSNATELNLPKLQNYLRQVLDGLKYLANRHIAHRDLKPENILLKQESTTSGYEQIRVAICDFGNAKILRQGDESISYICTRMYRAPELVLGAVEYKPSVDMWSLGCIVAEMALTTPLFGMTMGPSSDANEKPKPIDLWEEYAMCLGLVTETEWTTMNLPIAQYKWYLKEARAAQETSKLTYNIGLEETLKKIHGATLSSGKTKYHKTLGRYLKFEELFPSSLIDLLTRMLKYSPQERITPREALQHEFFKMDFT